MGILSDPSQPDSSSFWTQVLIKYHRPPCFILCLIGYVWFCLLAHKSFNSVNYFSENSLLPGLVQSDLMDDGSARQYLHELKEEINEKYATRDEMPVPWLAAKMRQHNMEVYTHNFTLNYPLGKGQVFRGENVYGIMRAGRSASTEALVLSVPYRPLSSHHRSTLGGIALLLSFAKFARSRKYWAKDIIFLVTAHEQLGVQAWLEAYHGQDSEAGAAGAPLQAGQLQGRAGAIQAAINLEMASLGIKYMEVKMEGLNGQLPNLDLVNLVHKMCIRSNIHHAYKNSYSWVGSQGPWQDWMNALSTLLVMVTTQLTGVPTGNHGLYHRYGIEAVTLEGVEELEGTVLRLHPRASHPGLLLEGILRSLNNLLERFHQSFFFYLRPNTDRFISIGQYIAPLGALAAALFLRAFALCLSSDNPKQIEASKDDKDPDDKSEKKSEESSKDADALSESEDTLDSELDALEEQELEEEAAKSSSRTNYSFMNVGITYFLMHAIGFAAMWSPQLLSDIGVKQFSLPTEEAIFYGFVISASTLTIFLPRTVAGVLRGGCPRLQQRMLHALAVLQLTTLCLAVAMHNFSLGFCMAAVYTPAAICQGTPSSSRLKKFLGKCLWLAVHPLVLTTASVLACTWLNFPEESARSLLGRGLHASQHAVMFSIVDSMIYGNWLFNVVTSVLIPVWLLFWQVINMDVPAEKI